ncbi:hypothetical protein B7494_g8116 [Chlorociboria aeruginascens]|nr:hypothetical protein B7494_g8116 [Chlorociboria aeruginascens]
MSVHSPNITVDSAGTRRPPTTDQTPPRAMVYESGSYDEDETGEYDDPDENFDDMSLREFLAANPDSSPHHSDERWSEGERDITSSCAGNNTQQTDLPQVVTLQIHQPRGNLLEPKAQELPLTERMEPTMHRIQEMALIYLDLLDRLNLVEGPPLFFSSTLQADILTTLSVESVDEAPLQVCLLFILRELEFVCIQEERIPSIGAIQICEYTYVALENVDVLSVAHVRHIEFYYRTNSSFGHQWIYLLIRMIWVVVNGLDYATPAFLIRQHLYSQLKTTNLHTVLREDLMEDLRIHYIPLIQSPLILHLHYEVGMNGLCHISEKPQLHVTHPLRIDSCRTTPLINSEVQMGNMSSHSHANAPGTRGQSHTRRPIIPEEDQCPVCHQELPSSSLENAEALRDSHIRTCIEQYTTGGTPPSSSHLSSSAPITIVNSRPAAIGSGSSQTRRTGYVPYKATEKDCIEKSTGGEDIAAEYITCTVSENGSVPTQASARCTNMMLLVIEISNSTEEKDISKVAKHNTSESCWVSLYGDVWDVTEFLPSHPGGSKIILQLAGKDATDEYDPIHPPGTLEDSLKPEAKLGKIDGATLAEKEPDAKGKEEDDGPPDLQSLLNLEEIEEVATKIVSKKCWSYYYSAADDLFSKNFNNQVYRQILLRPRIFVDCTKCDLSTTLLGYNVGLPLYVSPAAMARLAHPAGEQGIAQGISSFGALQIVSHNASMTPEQIVQGSLPGQIFGWQLYVQNERRKSEAMLARINKMADKYKFVCLTLDAPVPGKREHDERYKDVGSSLPVPSGVKQAEYKPPRNRGGGGVGRALFMGTAADLTWKTTLPWLAKHTSLPIVLKGIQTHEDAYLAAQYAPQVKAIILSNHGGRGVDFAPPAVHTLLEVRKYCPEVFTRIEVWVDGGIKRGTDVVKALCLGARAVGVGRAALFGLGAGGPEGVHRTFESESFRSDIHLILTGIRVLQAEIETCMRLLGVDKVSELGPKHVFQSINQSLEIENGTIKKTQDFIDATVEQLLFSEAQDQFPCGATFNGNSSGAPIVQVPFSWLESTCPGWHLADSARGDESQWILPFVGFILPAVVFCLTIPRRRKLAVPRQLFVPDLSEVISWVLAPFAMIFAGFFALCDTTIWLSTCFAVGGPMLLSGLYEAYLDSQILGFLNDKKNNSRLTLDMRARLLFVVLIGNLDLDLDTREDDTKLVILHSDPEDLDPWPNFKSSAVRKLDSPWIHIENLIHPLRSFRDSDISTPRQWPIHNVKCTLRGCKDPRHAEVPIRRTLEIQKEIWRTKTRLRTMLNSQYSFGTTVGAPVIFFIGAFVFTLEAALASVGDQDTSLALAFGMWFMIIPHISIVSGLLLAGNNPNVLESVVAGELGDIKEVEVQHFGTRFFELAYDSRYKTQWLWLRGRSKRKWVERVWKTYKLRPPGPQGDEEPDKDMIDLRKATTLTFMNWGIVIAMTLLLLCVPFLLAFLTAFYTPQIGLSCRSFTFLIYDIAQLSQITIWLWAYAGPPSDSKYLGIFRGGGILDRHGFYTPTDISSLQSEDKFWSLESFWAICWYFLATIFGICGVFSAIGGTLMQLLGVYTVDICQINVDRWTKPHSDIMVIISANYQQEIHSANTYWKACAITATVFLGVVSFCGWWYQRRLRGLFKELVRDIGNPESEREDIRVNLERD